MIIIFIIIFIIIIIIFIIIIIIFIIIIIIMTSSRRVKTLSVHVLCFSLKILLELKYFYTI